MVVHVAVDSIVYNPFMSPDAQVILSDRDTHIISIAHPCTLTILINEYGNSLEWTEIRYLVGGNHLPLTHVMCVMSN